MKLTRSEIAAKQADLVAVLLLLEKYKCEKTALEKALAADFEANEKRYREGVKTANGILIRRPNWKCVAKPVVEAA